MERGVIHTEERAKQIVSFRGLKYKYNITPTDFDGSADFSFGKAFVKFEIKTAGTDFFADSNAGQRMHLELDVDNHKSPTVLFVAVHNAPPEEQINAATTEVTHYYWRNQWYTVSEGTTLKDHIDTFLLKIGLGEYIRETP